MVDYQDEMRDILVVFCIIYYITPIKLKTDKEISTELFYFAFFSCFGKGAYLGLASELTLAGPSISTSQ
jgi:hypothetical protein